MASPAKPKRDSLALTFAIAVAGSLAMTFLMYRCSTVPAGLPPRPTPDIVSIIIPALLSGAICAGVMWIINRHRSRTFRPPGSCRACGYDRGGLNAGTPCPECGATSPPLA